MLTFRPVLPRNLESVEVNVDTAMEGDNYAVEAARGHKVEAVSHVVHEVGIEGCQFDALVSLLQRTKRVARRGQGVGSYAGDNEGDITRNLRSSKSGGGCWVGWVGGGAATEARLTTYDVGSNNSSERGGRSHVHHDVLLV
jgi:hypothetical protein